MKFVKSILLSSAAGLVAVTGASAADLGVKKPAAVDYVKTCPSYGAGFFVVPGTTSCLKLIGRVRADFVSGPIGTTQITSWSRAQNSNVFRARGYVGFDHRTATEYGLLRTYVRAFFTRENALDTTTLEYAFVQFGGLTAGRVAPVFEHGFSQAFYGGIGWADRTYANSIGYTASFGGGFSATLALDDATERRGSVAGTTYAGVSMPEITGKLNYEASWGQVHAVGVIHQVRVSNPNINTVYGFGGSIGTKINLPFLGKGSNLWLAGTYTDGANAYTQTTTFSAGNANLVLPDATAVGTSLKKTKTWGIAGGVQAFVAPTVWVALQANYAEVDPSGANNKVRLTVFTGTAGWTPVPGLLIGSELGYKAASAGPAWVAAGTDKDGFFGRLRFQRDF